MGLSSCRRSLIKSTGFFLLFVGVVWVILENGVDVTGPQISGVSGDRSFLLQFANKAHMNDQRLAIVMYIPNQVRYIHQFLGLIYGSWRFVVDNTPFLLQSRKSKNHLNIDLLVFCHPLICHKLPQDCIEHPLSGAVDPKIQKIKTIRRQPTCYRIVEYGEADIPYVNLNAFIMFNRSDIFDIALPYKYFLRTDVDCYLSPRILSWKPPKGMPLVVGQGGYCDKFNMERLKAIAANLSLVHQGVHCIGATWYGEVDLFIRTAQLTIDMTRHMFLNEFHPNLTGLETINFKANREGEWIRWWRPVSSMYGGELAVNHMVPNLTQKYKQPFDASSCSSESLWKYPHIHCWHDACEFSKFTFMSMLNQIFSKSGKVSAEVALKILDSSQGKDVSNMTVSEYCTYIAWNSAGRFMKQFM